MTTYVRPRVWLTSFLTSLILTLVSTGTVISQEIDLNIDERGIAQLNLELYTSCLNTIIIPDNCDCNGRMQNFTFRYEGVSNTTIYAYDKNNVLIHTYDNLANGDIITVNGVDKMDRLLAKTFLQVDGGPKFEIHTSCSEQILGNIYGPFTIMAYTDGEGGSCQVQEREITVSSDKEIFTCDELGENLVQLTFTDDAGNSCTKTVTVTIVDDIAPTVKTKDIARILSNGATSITPQDVIEFDCEVGGISVPEPVPGAGEGVFFVEGDCTYDNCGITTYEIDKPDFDCSDAGENIVTVTVTDASGNTTTATATVFIIDQQAPQIYAKDITVELGEDGNVIITPEMINDASYDPCGDLNLELSKTDFSCENIGANSVTLIGTDASGNSATATATVTVVDNAAPTVVTQNITLSLSAAGTATIEAKDLLVICDDAVLELQAPAPPPRRGRRSPAPGSADIAFNEFASIFAIDGFNAEGCTTDNCKITKIEATQVAFDCSHIGQNTVTVTVTDGSGNATTATAIVTIIDDIAPTVTTQSVSLDLDANGNATLTVDQAEVSSSDNCGIDSKVLSKTSFDCSDLGTQNVDLTVTDVNGNVTVETFQVFISDNIAPTVITQNTTVFLDQNGEASITVNDIDNGSFDNCSLTLNLDRFSFDCSDVGNQTVTLTGTDESGNSTSATAIVSVVDNISPTIDTQDIQVSLSELGAATITLNQVVTGSFDNCGTPSLDIDITDFDCDNIGDNTVTITATDASGNTTTATVTVTIVDDIAPTVKTKDIARILSNGATSITPQDVIEFDCEVGGISVPEPVPGAGEGVFFVEGDCTYDNCGITTYEIDKPDFDCSDAGENIVTVTVTDASGNTTTATATVFIIDQQAPQIYAKDITVELGEDGNVIITPEMINDASYDPCGDLNLELSKTDFSCENIGANSVTLIGTDASGNSATATATVTVVDNAAPTVVTQNITLSLSAAGTATIEAKDLLVICDDAVLELQAPAPPPRRGRRSPAPGSADIAFNEFASIFAIDGFNAEGCTTDNCKITKIEATQVAFDCSHIGQNTVTVTVTDGSGNATTATAIVTIIDDIAPTVTTQSVSLDLDANGNATLTVDQAEVSSSDNCGIDSKVLSKTSFDCSDLGTQNVDLTVTDVNGNVTVETFQVFISDNIAPTVITQNTTVFLDQNGEASITVNDIDNGSFDNCSLTLNLDRFSFDCSDVGNQTVTLTGTDESGNSTSATAIVSVVDNISPTIDTQDIQVSLSELGAATITLNQVVTGSFDNCGTPSLDIDITDFDCDNIGDNTVTITATDASGNTTTATVTVTIVDDIAPTVKTKDIARILSNGATSITPQDVIEFDCEVGGISVPEPVPGAGEGVFFVEGDCTYDNCGITTYEIDKPDFDCSDAGENIVTVTVTDASGNTTTATATVFIIDQQAPQIYAKDITVELGEDGNVIITPEMINDASYDPCGDLNLELSKTDFSCENIGANSVTLIGTDASGNSATATATVTVVDNAAPTVVTQNITLSLSAAGTATIESKDLLVICDDAVLELEAPAPPPRRGRRSPAPGSADIAFNEFASIFAIDGFNAEGCTTDNCKITKIEATQVAFDCSHIGQNTVTVTVTDGSGNATTATAIVTIIDDIAPTVTTQSVSLDLDANGNATLTVDQAEVSSSDNCGIDSKVLSKTSFDCSDLGTQNVDLTVTDVNGNVTVETFQVFISDNIAPTVITQNTTVFLDQNGEASITVNDIDNGSFDNCSLTLNLDRFSFDCSDVGNQTVTLTGTDESGNSTSATAIVSVVDNISPTIDTQDIQVSLSELGAATITLNQVVTGSFDNCGTPSLDIDITDFDCDNIGDNTVTITATDASGNTTTATVTVTIVDDIAPTVITQNTSVFLDENGTASITVNDIDNGSFDNCSLSLSVDQITFDCSDLGDNIVTLTGTDESGNTNSATAVVTVIDNIIPQAVAQDLTVALGNNGTATITASMVNNGSTDNCGTPNISINQEQFDCSHLGENTIILTVTDASGNVSTSVSTITVVDELAPVFTTNVSDITIQLEGNSCESIVSWNEPTATDNCDSFTISSNYSSGDTFPVGTTEVIYTATDASGNSSSTSFNVEVLAAPITITSTLSTYGSNAAYNVSCFGASDGTIDISVNGGCGDHTFMWSDGSTSQNLQNLTAGTYSVLITDSKGNTANESFTIAQPDELTVETTMTPQTPGGNGTDDFTIYLGYGDQTATLTALANGGSGSYTYQWSPADDIDCVSDNNITVAPQVTTTYTVLVTDELGCTVTETFTVEVIDARCSVSFEPCECDGKMQNFTVVYLGESGASVKAYKKDKKKIITSFSNVQKFDELTVHGFSSKGQLDSKTYLEVGGEFIEIHTSCSEDINGQTYGPFMVVEYTDGEGTTCNQINTSPGQSDDDDDDKGKDDDDDDKGSKDDDDDDKGKYDDFKCDCEGKMQNFTFQYLGLSGATIEVYDKYKDNLLGTYLNVSYLQEIVVDFDVKNGTLDSKTFLKIGNEFYEIHTSCSEDILGETYGPFKITAYTDSQGSSCSDDGNGGAVQTGGFDDDDDDKGKDDDDDDKGSKDDDDDDKGGKYDDFKCDCEGKMQNFTAEYRGLSGVTIDVFGKDKKYKVGSFENVQSGESIVVDFDIKSGKLDSKTYLKIGNQFYEIHTSCSEDILGETYGPFKITAYTDGEGNSCTDDGNGGVVQSNSSQDDDDDDKGSKDDDDDDKGSKDDDDDDKGSKDDDDDDKGSKDDDDDDKGGKYDDFKCDCEGKMQNFTVLYEGLSGATIYAYDKYKDDLLATFSNVQSGDELQVNGSDKYGRLDSKTYLRFGNQYYEVHTSCSEDILGDSFGPFTAVSYTDGEGNYCSEDGQGSDPAPIDTPDQDTECKLSAAENGGHAMWLSYYSQGQHARYYFVNNSGKLKEKSDGTATVTGLLQNSQDPTDQWEISIDLENKMSWAEWSALGRSYKDENGYAGSQYISWSYYEMANSSKLIGLSSNQGIEKPLAHMPTDYRYGFQVGTGANNKNANFGISGWFFYDNRYGESYQGDINMDVSGCMVSAPDTDGCDLVVEEWTGGVSMCFNGRPICVSQTDVQTFLDLGASIGNCSNNFFTARDDDSKGGGLAETETPSNLTFVDIAAYPNPTQGRTTITVQLSEESPVRIGVFNTSGIQVGTVFEGIKSGDQTHTFEFDGTDLFNGVYMIRVNVGGEVHIKKLLIRH